MVKILMIGIIVTMRGKWKIGGKIWMIRMMKMDNVDYSDTCDDYDNN